MGKNVTFFSLAYFLGIGIVLWISTFFPKCTVCSVYDAVARMLLICIIAHYTLPFVKNIFFNHRVSPRNKAVLITGCDSGFGHHLAKKLDSIGFHVFASCLFPTGDGAKALKESCSDSLHVLGLDVTKDDSVKEALAYIKENLKEFELWAIVNNAGVLKGFEVEWTRIEELQGNIDVNTMGVVRVTKAFLPLLRRSKGRVVTVTSVAGRISIPSLTFYSMSKYATSCFCECLRQELYPWEIKVITIEPEAFGTSLTNWPGIQPLLIKSIQCIDEDVKEDYGVRYFEEYKEAIKRSLQICSSQIQKVGDCLEDAITLEEPRNVYAPCRNAFSRLFFTTAQLVPKSFSDAVCRILLYIAKFPKPREAEHRF